MPTAGLPGLKADVSCLVSGAGRLRSDNAIIPSKKDAIVSIG